MKAWKVIRSIFVWLMVFFAVGMMVFTVISVSTFDRADRKLFGYKAFIVLSDSMSKTDFNAGDLVLVKEVDPATLQEGDIIAYTSQNTANYGETVTHKIRSLTTDASGEPGFITYGTTTDTDDETVVTAGQIQQPHSQGGYLLPVFEVHPRVYCVHSGAVFGADSAGGRAVHSPVPQVQGRAAGRAAGGAG